MIGEIACERFEPLSIWVKSMKVIFDANHLLIRAMFQCAPLSMLRRLGFGFRRLVRPSFMLSILQAKTPREDARNEENDVEAAGGRR